MANDPRDDDGTGLAPEALDRCLKAAYPSTQDFGTEESVLVALQPVVGETRRIRLRHPSADAPPGFEGGTHPGRIGRYEILGEIARGGLGSILVGHDLDLGRDVAIKMLLEHHAGDSGMTQRLLEEAQIGGQLQHPGIVPVYDVGLSDDLRPFLSMKLVRGRSLAELLARRSNSADDRMRLLSVFEQVCHAVGYAHSRGVVHRDIKPANVMVGAFGEVQVVDWGLAKWMDDPAEVLGASTPASASSSVAGTPGYMAPEQARGEVVDERSDVFGLGAILCQILTGSPPFVASSPESQRLLSAAGDLRGAHAALASCDADSEVVDLAVSCLASDPANRPRSAGEVAARTSAYRNSVESRARQAELAAVSARAEAAEARSRRVEAEAVAARERHRRLRQLHAGVASAAILLLGLGVYLWIAAEHRARVLRTAEAIDLALDRAHSGWGAASGAYSEAAWARAVGSLDEAEALGATGEPDPSTLQRLRDFGARLRSAAEAAHSAAKRLDLEQRTATTLEAMRENRADANPVEFLDDTDFHQAFLELGIDVLHGDPAEVAAAIRRTSISSRLVDALDSWLRSLQAPLRKTPFQEHQPPILAVAALADDDEARCRIRSAWAARDLEALQRLAASPGADTWSADANNWLAFCLSDLGDAADAKLILQASFDRHPDHFWTVHDLAVSCNGHTANSRSQRLRYLSALFALRPHSPHVLAEYGLALVEDDLPTALEILRGAVDANPDLPGPRAALGEALLRAGDAAAALEVVSHEVKSTTPQLIETVARAAIKVGKLPLAMYMAREAACRESRRGGPHAIIAILQHTVGREAAALEEMRQAISLDPDNPRLWCNLSGIMSDREAALAAAERALTLDPTYADAYHNLARSKEDLGDLPGAIAAYEKALDLAPGDPMTLTAMGHVLRAQGKGKQSLAAYEKALAVDPKFAEAWCGIAKLRIAAGTYEAAMAASRSALAAQPGYVFAYQDLGIELINLQRMDEAEEALRSGLALHPKDWRLQALLGMVCLEAGKLEEAAGLLGTAAKAAPDNLNVATNLSAALARLGRYEEALAPCQRAVALDPGDWTSRLNLVSILTQLGRYGEAVEAGKVATQMFPRSPEAWHFLGAAYDVQYKIAEAAAAYRRALELGYAKARDPLQACQEILAVEPRMDALLSGKETVGNADEAMAAARWCKSRQQFTSALKFFEDAFARDLFAQPGIHHPHLDAARAAAHVVGGAADGTGSSQTDIAHWRTKARDWLDAEVQRCKARIGSGDAEEIGMGLTMLGVMRQDQELAPFRDDLALATMPPTDAAAFRALWAEIDALLARK